MALPFLLSLPLHPFLWGGSLCVSVPGQRLRDTNAGYNSLEAWLEFQDPDQDFKLAPLKSSGLLSGKFSSDITADADSR